MTSSYIPITNKEIEEVLSKMPEETRLALEAMKRQREANQRVYQLSITRYIRID